MMKQLLKSYLEAVIAGHDPAAVKPPVEKLDVVVKFTDHNVWMADEADWCFPSGYLFEKLISLKEQGNTNLADELNGCVFTLEFPRVEMNLDNPKIKSNYYLDFGCTKFNIKGLDKQPVHYSFSKEYFKENASLKDLAEKAFQKKLAERDRDRRPGSVVVNKPYKDPMMSSKAPAKAANEHRPTAATSTGKEQKKETKPAPKKPIISKDKRSEMESSTAETAHKDGTSGENSNNPSQSELVPAKQAKEGSGNSRAGRGQASTSRPNSKDDSKQATKGKGGKAKPSSTSNGASSSTSGNQASGAKNGNAGNNSAGNTQGNSNTAADVSQTAQVQNAPPKPFDSALAQSTTQLAALPPLKATMSIPLAEDITEFRSKLRELEQLRTEFLQGIWAQVIEADTSYLADTQHKIADLLSQGVREMQGQVQATKKAKGELRGVAELIESRKVELEVVDSRLKEVSDRYLRLSDKYQSLKGKFGKVEGEIKKATDEKRSWQGRLKEALEIYDDIKGRYDKMKNWISTSNVNDKYNLGKEGEVELKRTLAGGETGPRRDRDAAQGNQLSHLVKAAQSKPVTAKASSRRQDAMTSIIVADEEPTNKGSQKKPAVQRVYAESSSTQSRVVASGNFKAEDFIDEASKEKARRARSGYQNPTHYEDVDDNNGSNYLGKRKIIQDERRERSKPLGTVASTGKIPVHNARSR